VPRASLEKQGIIPADEIAEVAALNYRKRRRAHEAGRNGESAARAMFVSYSRENAAWCKRLLPVLKVKANVDTLQPWHETELCAQSTAPNANGVRAGETLKRTATGTMRFIPSVTASSRRSRKRASDDLRARIRKRVVDSGSGPGRGTYALTED
jgi:hypothetical protein